MILAVAAFVQLATQCGPTVHVDTLTAVAQAESRLNTLAIHDNKTGQTYAPATLAEAVRIATDLVTKKGHSADLGLMQVNSANLSPFGMTISDAFDACKNIAAGARVLVAAYDAPASGDVQPALMRALSRYNTGNPARGFTNGYVARVQLAAGQVVPAIRVGAGADGQQGGEGAAPPPPPPPPPSWDVFGQARYQREHGGLVYGTPPAQPQSPPPPPPASAPAGAAAAKAPQPVQLQTVAGIPDGGGQ